MQVGLIGSGIIGAELWLNIKGLKFNAASGHAN
jgi:hypothetical protein